MAEYPIRPKHNVFKKYRIVNYINSYVFAPPVDLSTNTEIGGVASTISTPALLASKLAIDVSRITNFSIVGSDIKCKITGSYGVANECFTADTNITYYRDVESLVNEIRYLCFAGCTNFSELKTDGVVVLTSSYHVQNTPKLIEISLPNLVSVSDEQHFIQITNPVKKYIYLPKLTTIGSPSVNGNCFQGNPIGTKIYVHPSMATNNSGSPDADLVAATNAGMIVRYVNNYISPSSATMSNMEVYNTSIKLLDLFNNTNNLDHFEVSLNGGDLKRIDVNDYIPDLIKNTNYSIAIKAVDINYNKSPVSTISVTTSNISAQVERVGLVSYYKGDTLNDNFGLNNLTNSGVSINQTGKVSKGFLSTATAQKLVNNSFTAITGNFTINAWCYPTSNPSGQYSQIFGIGGYNANTGFSLWINQSRQLSWRIGQDYEHYSALTTLPLNQWTMVTLVYNGSTIKRFINGVQITSESKTGNPIASTIIQIFTRPESDGYFIGNISEPCVYKKSLSQAQIDELYNGGTGITL
jgi:hypothetical protein